MSWAPGEELDVRVAAYGVAHDERGVLLAHWNESGVSAWTLPGGGLDPGEDPADAVVREVEEETGYLVEVEELLAIDSVVFSREQRLVPGLPAQQQLRIVYRVRVVGGEPRDEVDGSTDTAAWFPLEEVGALEQVSQVALGLRAAGLA